ncbi:SlyX family protein [Nevskia ramosa]|uniref:SlyX family protein n=1 Tax=Nevskia ramosa TaxID=64002 RepID=UPI0003B68976|nr:SlyX family protein [Nevskia ramosa]
MSSSEDRPEDRLVELETRMTWQEDSLNVLSAEIQRQQRLIELLEQRLKALGDRLASSDQPVFQGTARDEIPPHW